MVADLVRSLVPGIRTISANPGDWGIDAFAGDLTGVITVWQAKYFYPCTTAGHKQQITKSFDSMIKAAGKHNYTVDKWVLCIASSMDGPTSKWWDTWKKEQSQNHNIDIELWDETELRNRLLAPGAEHVRRAFYDPYSAPALPGAPQPQSLVPMPGRPVAECDPFTLEVQRCIERAGAGSRELPPYVTRNHDERLQARVDEALGGTSQMIVLAGEPSTGKTRALWEAVRQLPADWRLWHPLSAEDLLHGLSAVGPGTALWLNNLDTYVAREEGERASAGLRNRLRDVQSLLVLGTILPRRLDSLTTPALGISDDIHQHARDLLDTDAEVIAVPYEFTGPELDAARAMADDDPRLQAATIYAENGRITQYLAGVPALVKRCQYADTPTQAVLKAAADLRRYGHDPENLPRALLEHAASAYIDRQEWDRLPPSWFEDALEYLGRDCQGIAGPLIRRRPLPGCPDEPCYRLASFLVRWAIPGPGWGFPPDGFWEAAAQHARTSADWLAMGEEARRYGRYRYAARLFELSAQAGHQGAWKHLVEFVELLGRSEDARTIAQRSGLPCLPQELTRFRDDMEMMTGWARRQQSKSIAPQLSAVELEMRRLQETGGWDEAVQYALQAADEGDISGLEEALSILEEAGEREQAESIAIGYTNAPYLLQELVQMRVRAGDQAGAEHIAYNAVDYGHPIAVDELANVRESAGYPDEAHTIRRYGLTADASPSAPW
ncbi:ATP-binding protein [Streptomyces sp. NPDC055709]